MAARRRFTGGLIRTVLDDHELELRVEVKDVFWPWHWWFWMASLIIPVRGKRTELEGPFVFPKEAGG